MTVTLEEIENYYTILLDENGKEVARKIGAMPKYKLYEWIESTVLGYRNGNET